MSRPCVCVWVCVFLLACRSRVVLMIHSNRGRKWTFPAEFTIVLSQNADSTGNASERRDWTWFRRRVPETRRYISEASGGASVFQLHEHDGKTWAGTSPSLSFFFLLRVDVETWRVRNAAASGEQRPLSCSLLQHRRKQKPATGEKVPPSRVITTHNLPPPRLIHLQLIAIAPGADHWKVLVGRKLFLQAPS